MLRKYKVLVVSSGLTLFFSIGAYFYEWLGIAGGVAGVGVMIESVRHAHARRLARIAAAQTGAPPLAEISSPTESETPAPLASPRVEVVVHNPTPLTIMFDSYELKYEVSGDVVTKTETMTHAEERRADSVKP